MLKYRLSFLLASIMAMPTAQAMTALSDKALSSITGQSLIVSNYVTNSSDGDYFGYYRMGLDAEMELNANIRRLALGCDGAGGTGVCDIDINNLRLMGADATSDKDSGPETDFMLRRPYLELAVKEPNQKTKREIVGFRVGAYEALGKLSAGENPNVNNVNDDTGIKRLSGFMSATLTNTRFTNVGVTFFGGCCIIGPTTASVSSHTAALELNRSRKVTIGNVEAEAAGLTLSNAWINNEPLDNIHNILVADNMAGTQPTKDFYISNQKEALHWQNISNGQFGGTVPSTYRGDPSTTGIPKAKQGWWMFLPQVQIPDVTTDQKVRISTTEGIGGVFGTRVNINPVDLQQKPLDNCYGSLTFC